MVRQSRKVLIVDDEQVICDVLRDELSDQGYLCSTALNGNDALTELLAQDFDVALVDIRLPGMSGLELLRQIRSHRSNVAVIIMTVVNDAQTVVKAIKLGAADYIVKPFDLHTLHASMRSVLDANTYLAQTGHGERPLSAAGEQGSKQDTDRSPNRMDAIAFGVEAKLDLLDGHSKRVTERTINVARQLGIPEREIQRWATARARCDSEEKRQIDSLLKKVERNPLAQSIMGTTAPHLYTPNSSGSQN